MKLDCITARQVQTRNQNQGRGLSHFRPANLAKSVLEEQSSAPCSIANAARNLPDHVRIRRVALHDRTQLRMLRHEISIKGITPAIRLRLDGSGEIIRTMSPVGWVGLFISPIHSKLVAGESNSPMK